MKKIIGIVILSLLASGNIYAAGPDGKGDLKISSTVLQFFQDYLRGGVSEGGKSTHNRPAVFWVTLDGSDSYFWYCPHGQCRSGNSTEERNICERYTNKECARFARGRTVKWKNSINPGRGKESLFNSKWSNAEITAKLTELGFYGNTTSSITTTTPKITKKKKEVKKLKNDEGIVKNLKELKELLDSGVLSQEEFETAKKKILN